MSDLKERLAATTFKGAPYLMNPDGPEALARIEELEGRLAIAVLGLQRIDAEARDAAAMAEAGYSVSAGGVAEAAYEVSTLTLSSIQDAQDE